MIVHIPKAAVKQIDLRRDSYGRDTYTLTAQPLPSWQEVTMQFGAGAIKDPRFYRIMSGGNRCGITINTDPDSSSVLVRPAHPSLSDLRWWCLSARVNYDFAEFADWLDRWGEFMDELGDFYGVDR